MSLDAQHPLYTEKKDDWVTMRDLYKGERVVKSKGETYLPATKGMKLDGMGTGKLGQEVYDAYRLRAVFPDHVKDAVEAFIGLLHQKPPTIELPEVMEPIRERATMYGEPLELLLRRINEEQLVTGRCGLLLDLPEKPDPANPMPYIALYITEAVRNWDDAEIEEGESRLNLVVLDESGYKRDKDFTWIPVTKYRVLQLGEILENEQEGAGSYYQVGVFKQDAGGAPAYDPTKMVEPMLRGTKLEEIPFVFVNSKDIVPAPDEPPLMGLGRLALAIYRGEADYRQNLFMQGQDTFVVIGERRKVAEDPAATEGPVRTGAGSMVELETGGDAKYVGVNSSGLPEQRTALENDRKRAESRSGQLIDATGGDKESGEALKVRVGAQTATLNLIAETGAAALEAILKHCAKWMGANPDDVKVMPNLEFSDFEMTGEELVKLMAARTMGAPLSKRSIHDRMTDRGLTKLTYEEELELVQEENAQDPLQGTDAGGNPADDDDDEGGNTPPGNRNPPRNPNDPDGDE